MDNIFQAPDLEFVTLQKKVKCQKSEKSRSLIGRMPLSLTGNTKPIKKQVAINRISRENSKDVAKLGDDTLDGSYINRNNECKTKGTVTERDMKAENAKQLVIDDFNKKCDEYF